MLSIADLKRAQGNDVVGQYRIMSVTIRAGVSGPFVEVGLADYSGSLLAHAQLGSNLELTHIRPGDIIQATLRPRTLNGRTVATLEDFSFLPEVQVINAASLIPQAEVPPAAHAALADLVACIDLLGRAESKQFMRRLLLDSDAYRPFVTAPAGKTYHHAYPGGLLVHTVGCMRKAEQMTRWVCAGGASAIDLALLGGFVHDLGKIRTLGGTAGATLFHRMRHELMTAPIIAEPLQEMSETWSHGAERLGELVDWLSQPESHRRKRVRLAELVHWADALDVMGERAGRSAPGVSKPSVLPSSVTIKKRCLI